MLRTLVNLRRQDEAQGRDLELPGELPVGDLAGLVAQALGWPAPACLRVEARWDGGCARALGCAETLASAGIWDGSCLVLERAAKEPPSECTESAALWSDSGKMYLLSCPQMILGRGRPSGPSPGAEFIDLGGESVGDTVSRSHARVRLVEGRWVLSTMPESRNLTAVNGSPLGAGEDRGLSNGDRITMGGVSLTLTLAGGAPPV
jgi:hypothetical protein